MSLVHLHAETCSAELYWSCNTSLVHRFHTDTFTVSSRQPALLLRLHCSESTSVIRVCCLCTLCPMSFAWKEYMCQGQISAPLFFPALLKYTKKETYISRQNLLCRDCCWFFSVITGCIDLSRAEYRAIQRDEVSGSQPKEVNVRWDESSEDSVCALSKLRHRKKVCVEKHRTSFAISVH